MMSSSPYVLIHEYFSGGGWTASSLPKNLVAEGTAMLQAVLEDFRDWGYVKTMTTRDHRLKNVELPANRVVELVPNAYFKSLEHLAKQCTAAFVIAPETNGILARLSALMKKCGAYLLGSSPTGVSFAANKWTCYQLFKNAGLPFPDTRHVNISSAMGAAHEMGFPLVVKPVDSMGCDNIHLVRDIQDMQHIFRQNTFTRRALLLQRYIKGTHASACILVAGNDVLCLSMNKQFIQIGMPFDYQGGKIPAKFDNHKEAVDLACRAAAMVRGLNGYIGVDLLVAPKRCHLIEINPRLTTSYIGLRQVVNINMAEAIWNAAVLGKLPENVRLSGQATIYKTDSPTMGPYFRIQIRDDKSKKKMLTNKGGHRSYSLQV